MVVVPAADDVTDGADVAEVSGGTDVTDHVDVIDVVVVAVSGTCDVVVAVVVVVSAVVAGSAIVPVLDEAVGADGSAIGGPVVSTPHQAADSAAMLVSATDRQRRPPRIRPSPSRAR